MSSLKPWIALPRTWRISVSPRFLFALIATLGGALLMALRYHGVLPLSLEYFAFYSLLLFLFALWRPAFAFLLFLSLLPLEIVTVTPSEWGIGLRPYQWVALMLGLALGIALLLKRIAWPLFRWQHFDTALTVLALGVLVSGLVNGGATIKQSIVVLSFLFLYFLARVFLRTVSDCRSALPFLLLPAGAVLVWATVQNILFLRGLEAYAVMPGRPNGTLAEPDWLGLYALFPLALSFAFLARRTIAAQRITALILPLAGVSGTLLVLILTVSRSAWLGALALFIVFFVLAYQRRGEPFAFRPALLFLKIVTLGFALAFLIAQGVPLTRFVLLERAESTASHFQTITIACPSERSVPAQIADTSELDQYGCTHISLEEKALRSERGEWVTAIERPDPNVGIRQRIYRESWSAIRDHPIVGIGWGAIGDRLGLDERGASYNASNLFLEVWLGGGLLALAGLLAFLGLVVAQVVTSVRTHVDSIWSATLFSIGAGLFVFDGFNSGILLGFIWVYLTCFSIHPEQSPRSVS